MSRVEETGGNKGNLTLAMDTLKEKQGKEMAFPAELKRKQSTLSEEEKEKNKQTNMTHKISQNAFFKNSDRTRVSFLLTAASHKQVLPFLQKRGSRRCPEW